MSSPQPKRPRGRPPLPKGEAKGRAVHARLSPEAYERIRRHAETLGQSVSEHVRQILEYWNAPEE